MDEGEPVELSTYGRGTNARLAAIARGEGKTCYCRLEREADNAYMGICNYALASYGIVARIIDRTRNIVYK